jgi:hypothetical protein
MTAALSLHADGSRRRDAQTIFRGNGSSRPHCILTEQRETAIEQRPASLFFRSRNRHWPRISAGNAISVADYLLEKQQKQQKQRELPLIQ